jgi:hypothetical protein
MKVLMVLPLLITVPSYGAAQDMTLQDPQGGSRYEACCTTCSPTCQGCTSGSHSSCGPSEVKVNCTTVADITVCSEAEDRRRPSDLSTTPRRTR